MDHSTANLITIALLSAFIWSQIYVVDARTRYEEFITSDLGDRLCAVKDNKKTSDGQPIDNHKCREYCEVEKKYATGGCDCGTLQCICANMFLDFCDFSNIRLYI